MKSSMAEAVSKARIVSIGDNLEPREIRQIFENWAGDSCPPMHQDQFLIMEPTRGTDHRADHHGASHHGPSTLWIADQKTGADYSIPCLRPVQHKHKVHVNAVPRDEALATIRDPSRDYPMRFFGWPAPIPTRNELHIFLWVSSENIIPKMCAQDLFQHFLGAMVAIMNSIGGQTNLVATAKDSFRLSNNVYSELVESIHESGLGSRQDAHVILVPVLGSRLPLIADVQLATQSAAKSKVRPA